MTTISIVIENPKNEDDYIINDKNTLSTYFLNKKRYKSDDECIDINKNKRISFFTFNRINKLDLFLSNFEKIIKDNEEFFQKEKKRYMETNFNLTLINSVFNYFSIMKLYLINVGILNSKELIDLIKTFYLNDLEFSVLTILLEEFLSNFSYIFEKENLYYLGLYSKHITSDTYKDIFYNMLNDDIYFKNWFLHYNKFLESRDLNLIKVNKRSNFFTKKEQKFEIVDYILMVNDIFELKTEVNNKIFFKKHIGHNVGKKIKVVIVYEDKRDKNRQNLSKKNQIDRIDLSNNDVECLQTDSSA